MTDRKSLTQNTRGYTSGELIVLAVEGKPVDPMRVLATYADESNWTRIHEHGRCWWSWIGPVIVGYELAGQGVRANHAERN